MLLGQVAEELCQVYTSGMRCQNCGQDNPSEAGFCVSCGAALAVAEEPVLPVGYGSFWIRLGAWILDYIFVIIFIIVLWILLTVVVITFHIYTGKWVITGFWAGLLFTVWLCDRPSAICCTLSLALYWTQGADSGQDAFSYSRCECTRWRARVEACCFA